jgi:muramoyltetrapeptide carboxypeptidase
LETSLQDEITTAPMNKLGEKLVALVGGSFYFIQLYLGSPSAIDCHDKILLIYLMSTYTILIA